jgi:outer membrane protein assembly factor BamB
MRFHGTLLAVFSATIVAMPAGAAGESRYGLCGTPADAFFAEEIGLRREWIVQVPFDASRTRLERVTVADGIVVVAAADGSLHGIPTGSTAGGPAAGTVAWTRHFDTASAGMHAPAIGSGIVVVVAGFQAFGIDQATGRTLWQEPLPGPPTASAVVSGDSVYLPIEGGRLVRLAVDPYRRPVIERVIERKGAADRKNVETIARNEPLPFGEKLEPLVLATHGRVDMPPLAFQRGVLWSTTDGTLTAIMPAKPEWQRLEFHVDSPLAGLPLVRDKSIFVATNTGAAAADVIRIDLLPVGMVFSWRVPIGEAVTGDMTLAGDAVLVPLATGGLAALAADDGSLRWTHERPLQLLTVTPQRLWCIDEMGRLASIDPADGTRQRQDCLGPFRLPVMNRASDRLVLAAAGGAITMLAPRVAPTPAAAPASPPAE